MSNLYLRKEEIVTETACRLNPKELVLKKHPSAYVDDDGEWVHIRVKKEVTGYCPHCGQNWTRLETVYPDVIGGGGTEEAAWDDAAKSHLLWYKF